MRDRDSRHRAVCDAANAQVTVTTILAADDEIGQQLYISDTTVKTHITHILQKLDLRDRVQAIVLAYETGLFDAGARPPVNQDERRAR
jgi:Bacterial regulatory proteins, luxR family